MKPTPSDVHVNAPLTNISVAYMQQAAAYIADKVFPVVPVQKQSDRFFKYGKADWFRDDAKERAPATESAGGGFDIDNTPSYSARVFAFHKDVDDQLRANADAAISPDRDATEYVSQLLMIRKDKQWASNFFTTGVWGTDLTGVAGVPGAGQFKQWDQAGSTPITDIQGQCLLVAEATGYKPNKLVLGARSFNILRNHADVLDRYKHTQKAIITEELLAAVFGVEQVLVAMATNNTAAEGATAAMSFIANSKSALLVYANPTPSLMKPSGGYTFGWTGLLGAGSTGSRIKRFRMEHLESDRIEGEMAWDQKVVAADVATFFTTAVA
jgi:hypothetical protein